ncbi:MAG: tetratricopeptide repeat protein [Candidatus Aureabacteria bacterium]|nr:tetratricopeptide repeat protein [Candidatus Auribacterota bacterium]
MTFRRVLAGLLIPAGLLLGAQGAFARSLSLALVPWENRTGLTALDYLGDLTFNLVVSELSEYGGLALFERQRSDLILRERSLSLQDLFLLKPAAGVEALVAGAILKGKDDREKVLELTVTWIAQTGKEGVRIRREIDSLSPDKLQAVIREMLAEGVVAPNSLIREKASERPVSGGTAAVIGFNNYSSLTEYDSLQKGIVYLLEERLSRNPGLQVVERDDLKKILKELQLQKDFSGGAPLYNLASADLLVAGCFTWYDRTFRLDARIINVGMTKIERAFHRESNRSGVVSATRDLIESIGACLTGGGAKREEAGDIYPATPEALLHYSRGVELYDQGEYLAAVECINRALSVDPGYTFGRWEAGRIYEEYLHLYDRAIRAYAAVLESKPPGALREKCLLRLGMINYNYLQNYPRAIEYLSRFLREFPDSLYRDVILYSLGHSQQTLGRCDQALALYQRALADASFSPLRGSFLVRAAQCAESLGDPVAARRYLETAIRENGDDVLRAETGAKEVTVKEEAGPLLSRLDRY